jgi:signal transduction histidine kinase
MSEAILVKRVLLVSSVRGVEACATTLMQQLHVEVEIAAGRAEALDALRAGTFSAVIVEESLAEGDPRGAELLWKMAGFAIPMQVNFAVTGSARLVRDLRAALNRREQEHSAAHRAAISAVESDLRSTVSGLVLHTQLALQESPSSPSLEKRLRLMAELAGTLKQRLETTRA